MERGREREGRKERERGKEAGREIERGGKRQGKRERERERERRRRKVEEGEIAIKVRDKFFQCSTFSFLTNSQFTPHSTVRIAIFHGRYESQLVLSCSVDCVSALSGRLFQGTRGAIIVELTLRRLQPSTAWGFSVVRNRVVNVVSGGIAA